MGPVNEVAADVENVIAVPFTLMESPLAKPLPSESEPAAPDSLVALLIGAAGAC